MTPIGKKKGWVNPFFVVYIARDVQVVDLPAELKQPALINPKIHVNFAKSKPFSFGSLNEKSITLRQPSLPTFRGGLYLISLNKSKGLDQEIRDEYTKKFSLQHKVQLIGLFLLTCRKIWAQVFSLIVQNKGSVFPYFTRQYSYLHGCTAFWTDGWRTAGWRQGSIFLTKTAPLGVTDLNYLGLTEGKKMVRYLTLKTYKSVFKSSICSGLRKQLNRVHHISGEWLSCRPVTSEGGSHKASLFSEQHTNH